MQAADMGSMSAFMLKMALNGYILRLDIKEIREMNRLLANATNNINQIAHRVNTDGSFYMADVAEIRHQQELIHRQNAEILQKLNEL
jgi:SepF-like predicted cell division protein (DUF552 family)